LTTLILKRTNRSMLKLSTGTWNGWGYASTMNISHIKKLVELGKAYACDCAQEKLKEDRFNGIECKHRSHTKEANTKLFDEMLAGKHEEDSTIIRFKGDMKSNNTALRDPTIARIKKDKHYRQGNKYVVWPTYDINTPVIDSIRGVTDVIRSKEFELRDELARQILEALGMRVPRIHSEARLVIKNNITHKSALNKLIKSNDVEGWDDPRLVTIAGLRKRGVQPQAIKSFVLRFGMSKMDGKVGMDMLLAENRVIIDGMAKRLFAIEDPIEVHVNGIPPELKKAVLKLHPTKNLGTREVNISNKFLITHDDAKTLKEGFLFRLKDLFNVKVEKTGLVIHAQFAGNENIDAPKFQWVNADDKVTCKLIRIGDLVIDEVFNPKSLIESTAYAERYVDELKRNEIVQFERVGFFKLDDFNEKSFIGL
jgi:glutamyl-tRNA synthetase